MVVELRWSVVVDLWVDASRLVELFDKERDVAGQVLDGDAKVVQAVETRQLGVVVQPGLELARGDFVVPKLVQKQLVVAEAVGHVVHFDDLDNHLAEVSSVVEAGLVKAGVSAERAM